MIAPQLIHGMRVYIATPAKQSKFKISSNVKLTREYRKTIDDWCDSFFGVGYLECIKNGDVWRHNDGLFMNQQTYNDFMKEMDGMK